MSEELGVLLGLAILLLVLFLAWRSRKKKNRGEVAVNRRGGRRAPPPLPVRGIPGLPVRYPDARALDYPKCPVDRCRNEAGKPQVIFWNSTQKCYICGHGHRFTGRE